MEMKVPHWMGTIKCMFITGNQILHYMSTKKCTFIPGNQSITSYEQNKMYIYHWKSNTALDEHNKCTFTILKIKVPHYISTRNCSFIHGNQSTALDEHTKMHKRFQNQEIDLIDLAEKKM